MGDRYSSLAHASPSLPNQQSMALSFFIFAVNICIREIIISDKKPHAGSPSPHPFIHNHLDGH
jgi:hypothetical protein